MVKSKQAYSAATKRRENLEREIKAAAKLGITFTGAVPPGEKFRTARSERSEFERGREGARATVLAVRNDDDVMGLAGQNLGDNSAIRAALPDLVNPESLKCSIEADLNRISAGNLDHLTPELDAKLALLSLHRPAGAVEKKLRSRLAGQVFKGIKFTSARGKKGGAAKVK